MKFVDLVEAVTNKKLKKLNDTLSKMIQNDPTILHRLLDLDWRDNVQVDSFCKECFGEPKGIYINTLDEQKRLLRRIYNDRHKESGSNFMRPEYTAISF